MLTRDKGTAESAAAKAHALAKKRNLDTTPITKVPPPKEHSTKKRSRYAHLGEFAEGAEEEEEDEGDEEDEEDDDDDEDGDEDDDEIEDAEDEILVRGKHAPKPKATVKRSARLETTTQAVVSFTNEQFLALLDRLHNPPAPEKPSQVSWTSTVCTHYHVPEPSAPLTFRNDNIFFEPVYWSILFVPAKPADISLSTGADGVVLTSFKTVAHSHFEMHFKASTESKLYDLIHNFRKYGMAVTGSIYAKDQSEQGMTGLLEVIRDHVMECRRCLTLLEHEVQLARPGANPQAAAVWLEVARQADNGSHVASRHKEAHAAYLKKAGNTTASSHTSVARPQQTAKKPTPMSTTKKPTFDCLKCKYKCSSQVKLDAHIKVRH
jgi:hypothetical protein